eukprot:CAMPEP_0206376576 /NCGR_PEP_ID=MMETSP0294-20121207/9561_1 /ASSEMBLY_ACC=CAM_ASM_000327 /TAXON_ID=39354 /ORGANISM="Heterosigma akashiwo, Strain CCMP2393" /LENGTH=72 /DNA_ID=CAMNT_0053824721 /DNA_START=51 /DNA_END=269 /DNA_ORIENTATION=+
MFIPSSARSRSATGGGGGAAPSPLPSSSPFPPPGQSQASAFTAALGFGRTSNGALTRAVPPPTDTTRCTAAG